MAFIKKKFGQAARFLAFTRNSVCPESSNELSQTQKANDRHHIIARVFHKQQKKSLWFLKMSLITG